jgi:hypothetical protein
MKYESPITCHSKDMTNVKVFTDRHANRQTDGQAKNYMSPIFRYGGIIIMKSTIAKQGERVGHLFSIHIFNISRLLGAVVRVEAQKSGDPCIRGCRSFRCYRIIRGPMSQ